jgi:hypothetical protein
MVEWQGGQKRKSRPGTDGVSIATKAAFSFNEFAPAVKWIWASGEGPGEGG